MPRCATDAPAQYLVDDALVRCLLYEEAAPAREPGDRPVTERAARD
jgi:hypothetical protein